MKRIPVILTLLMLVSCLKEDSLKQDYKSFVPPQTGDGWTVGSCAANKVDSLALDAVYKGIYENDELWSMKSLLVIRNGELLAESYLKDDMDRYQVQAVWSCTKQVMALLAGKLVDDNDLFLTDILEQHLPNYTSQHRDKADITMKNLLEMRSGIGFYNDDHSDVFRKKKCDNSLEFVLGLPLDHRPGTYFNYNDGDPQLLSGVFQAITGKKTDVWANEVLFSTLNIRNLSWYRYKDGYTLGAFGIMTTARELSKFGRLVLDSGAVDSNQVISRDWIRDMLKPVCRLENHDNIYMGHYWWTNTVKDYHFMWGHGGQYVFVIPSKNAVVTITGLEEVEDGHQVSVEQATDIVDRVVACMF